MKFSLLFVAILVLFSSCQSEVCKCADQWYEMTEALKKADEQKQDIREAFDLFDTDGTGASPRGRAAPASLAAFPSHCYCHCLCPSL
jgi:hypothetical protein